MNRSTIRHLPLRGRSCALAGLLLLALPGMGRAQDPAAELLQLEAHFDQARMMAVHLMAPRTFGRAVDRFDDATRRYQNGRTGEDFLESVAEANERLADAERIAEAARSLFAEALTQREAATRAESESRAAQSWQRAEAEFEDAGRRFERDDRAGATEQSTRALELYRRATRAGLRDMWLGAAIRARSVAMTAGGSELAPNAFLAGERFLADGEAEIEADRAGESTAEVGLAALAAFERSARIATLADSIRRRTVTVERLLDEHDDDLGRLAATAGVQAVRGQTGQTSGRISDELTGLQADNARLEAELADVRGDAAGLTEQLASLEQRLADSERRFVQTRSDLLEIRLREERLREAQGLFTAEEGEVFSAGNRLVLRLFGLTFESGSAEIDEMHHPLLTKVQRVITSFEGSTIRIEGHTDGQGQPAANQALSQRRAIAVREHLLTRIPIPSSRVEALGLGEDQPIASNQTEEGRARNRRIEVVLTLPEG